VRKQTLALIAAVVALIAVATVALWFHRGADQRDDAARHALAASTAAAQAIFSYDYRSFDTSVANGQSLARHDVPPLGSMGVRIPVRSSMAAAASRHKSSR